MLFKFFDKSWTVVSAAAASQCPLFIEQYQAHLRGRLLQLSQQMEQLSDLARQLNKTLPQWIQHLSESVDPEVAMQGNFLQQLSSQYHHFQKIIDYLSHASIWQKPLLFIKSIDLLTFKETWHHFQAGLLLNTETGVYALFGVFFAMVISQLVSKAWSSIFKKSVTYAKSSQMQFSI